MTDALLPDEALTALRDLDARLRECFGQPISAEEAYDSFYQEIVAAALSRSAVPPEPSKAEKRARLLALLAEWQAMPPDPQQDADLAELMQDLDPSPAPEPKEQS
jgi:hypothetical protein